MNNSVGMHGSVPTRVKPLPSVRNLLIWLVLACFLPGLVGGVIFLVREYQDGSAQLQANTLQTARAMVQAVDAQLAQAQLLAQTLATSDSLMHRDFAVFHQRALRLLREAHFAQSVLVYDINGQQLVNTRLPWGQALPRRTDLAQIQHVFETGKSVKPEVTLSPLTQMPVVSIAVPVYSGTTVAYALAIGMAPETFNKLLTVQALPADWVVAVLDEKGTIAARSRFSEKYVGQMAVPALRKYLVDAPEGVREITTSEGIQTVTPYRRSAQSGWSVAIGIPREGLEAQLKRKLLILALGAALLLGLSMGLIWHFGGRIAASVLALRTSAIALGNGTPLGEAQIKVREAAEVAQAMTNAATVLHERTQALADSLEELEAREVELAESHRIAKIGSWSWDSRTDKMRASQDISRMFGLPEIPPFAQQDGVMFPHEAWLELQKVLVAIRHTGQGYSLELPALHADGHQMWVNSRAEAVRGQDGALIGLRGTVQDITERKQSESIAHSERFIRAITDAMPALIAYWDRDLHCRFANQTYLDWWGISAPALSGLTLEKLMGESLFSINEPAIRAALSGQEKHFERFLTKPDGSVGHVLAHYLPDRDAYGQVAGFIIIVTDIKALKLAEAELKLAANVYQNVAEGIMVTDSNGIILSVNPAFTQITGYPAEEAVGQTPRLLRSDRHDQRFHALVWQQIATQGRWQGGIWNRRKDGGVFLEWQTITRIAGTEEAATRYVAVFHDITDSWQVNEDNRHLAFHDALTNLPNRALLMERLERQIARAKREPKRLAVMFLDLDRFKLVNDTLGHAVGDELLIAIAGKLQALVRQSDTVARLGGDEFVIKLDNRANLDEVKHVADRVIAVINEPIEVQGHQVQVGASVGIAMFPEHGSTAAELIKSADDAMYEAKRSGKNRYQFFRTGTVSSL